ncbi:helix-turn-helix domain-containing protein [Anaerovorax sp. IOR16]|uniref:helix-turn-helix domain-containing protein n=1 Tax=Anaerovorax sp. IOR16 TaxID=2773458 RepID=UPI0019CF5062|nr:helix-turn-helix transcriptional regulator [Anaerovorax sp. IOR16]
MGSNPTKAANNIYCKCRYEAAKYNDRLYSREGASELLGISVSTLSDYELGNTKVVPVDKVVLMADLYNSPELLNNYCTTECPIGCRSIRKLEVAELDRLTLKVLSAFQKVGYIKETLIDIAADGVITTSEKPQFEDVISALENISQYAQELKLWAEKNMAKEE